LQTLLRDDRLPHLGLVDVGKGSRLSFELAVRVTLADLARLGGLPKNDDRIKADRWRRACEDLERLHRMAVVTNRSEVHA
jgi:hypothetical protein